MRLCGRKLGHWKHNLEVYIVTPISLSFLDHQTLWVTRSFVPYALAMMLAASTGPVKEDKPTNDWKLSKN
jgi:hypothetical protein